MEKEVSLATITMNGNMDGKIDIKKMISMNKKHSIVFYESKKNKKQDKMNFFNSLTIKLNHKNSSNISIKLFSNGAIGITGLRSLELINEMKTLLGNILLNDFEDLFNQTQIDSINLKISMIRLYYKKNIKINQQLLKDFIINNNDKSIWKTAIKTDTYYALNLKYIPIKFRTESSEKPSEKPSEKKPSEKPSEKLRTISVFSNGSISIICKEIDEIIRKLLLMNLFLRSCS